MIDFLAGVPGKLKTLTDRLTATWAAKLDALRTGLTDTRMAYLDKLAITGNVASSAQVTACAQGTLPALSKPIASGIPAPSEPLVLPAYSYVSLVGLGANITMQSSTSTIWVDITTGTHTGAGMLKGLIFVMAAVGGVARTFYLDILIDGVIVLSYSYTTSVAGAFGVVPLGGAMREYNGGYQVLAPLGLDNIQFTTSIQCRIKTSNADSPVYALAKIIKTG